MQLICAFVFADAKIKFSHYAAQFVFFFNFNTLVFSNFLIGSIKYTHHLKPVSHGHDLHIHKFCTHDQKYF